MKRKLIRGVTFSSWDLLHAGYLLMFKECKQHCDYLIVGLHVDPSIENSTYRDKFKHPKHKPYQSLYQRYLQLKLCSFIDEIVPYETEAELNDILNTYDIDIRIIGEDWKGKEFTGWNNTNVKTIFNERKHDWSMTKIIEQIKNNK